MAIIQTVSGEKVNLLDPQPETININDIACGLSRLTRFVGQIRSNYTVAQHSVLVSSICPPKLALVGLLHDAAEAYIGDLVHPLKALMGEDSIFVRIERRLEQVIFNKFGIARYCAHDVKLWDRIAFATENRDLRGFVSQNTADPEPLEGFRVETWDGAGVAIFLFLQRFQQLTTGSRPSHKLTVVA